jgi:3-oxoacyl-[acyl-carrier protein] reductase
MSERKTVVVTGASSGIGRATAVRFAREGWNVCITARRGELLEELKAGFPVAQHLAVAGDYSDPATADAIGEAIRGAWGRLDVLVNCAGVYIGGDPISTLVDEWRRPFDIMVNGAVYLTRMAVPLMPDGGRIVHITSIHGERAERGSSAYAMAKAALNQYCRGLALDLASRNILVNAIAPGFIDTAMSIVNGVSELQTPWFRQNYVEGHHLPLRRAGQPEEIAGVAWFLAGPDATYLTGQIITVDGGLTITF